MGLAMTFFPFQSEVRNACWKLKPQMAPRQHPFGYPQMSCEFQMRSTTSFGLFVFTISRGSLLHTGLSLPWTTISSSLPNIIWQHSSNIVDVFTSQIKLNETVGGGGGIGGHKRCWCHCGAVIGHGKAA